MIYLLLLFQFGLIMSMRLRLRGFNPAEAASWFLWLSEIVYINGDFFIGSGDTGNWQTYSYSTHPERLIVYYTAVVVMFTCSTIGIKRLSTSITELRQSILVVIARVAAFEPALLAFTGGLFLAYVLVVDWNIVLSNNTYLLMGSWEATTVDKTMGGLVLSLFGASALISSMFVAISFSRGFNFFAFCWTVIFTFQLAIAVGGASRSGAMLLAIVTLFSGLFAKRSHPFRLTFLALCSAWLYCAALGGRSEGHFGFTAIPGILVSPFTLASDDWLGMLSSIFQGAFIAGDGLDFSADFNPTYKLLSFSPLPSAIDHFSTYLALYEIRLQLYVPMGAQTEVIFFGPGYTALFWGTMFLLCRTLTKNKKHVGIFYYFGSLYFLVTFMQTGAYPTRNVYRTFLLLLLIGMFLANKGRSAAAKAARMAAARKPVSAA